MNLVRNKTNIFLFVASNFFTCSYTLFYKQHFYKQHQVETAKNHLKAK